MFLLFVCWSACLLILELFFFLTFILQRRVSPQIHNIPLTSSLSASPTHAATHTHKCPSTSHPHSSVHVPPEFLTDFLVLLQSRKASEQTKSVDSKTDSIGSGRAIPIKQVSRCTDVLSPFLIILLVSIVLVVFFNFLFNPSSIRGKYSH